MAGSPHAQPILRALLLAVFVGGAVLFATHPHVRDQEIRHTAVLLMATAAALFMAHCVLLDFRAARRK